ncbi:MAG: hypothetical protein HZB16_06130 [Armatimonadetes bacterium]|nr:hypothetical protein [Armatimonadota bacterium]
MRQIGWLVAVLAAALSPLVAQTEPPTDAPIRAADQPLGPAQPPQPPAPNPSAAAQTTPLGSGQLSVAAKRVGYDQRRGLLTAKGGVRADYQDMHIRSGELRADLRGKTVELPGDSQLSTDDGVTLDATGVNGQFEERRYHTGRFQMTIPPKVAGYGLQEPITINGTGSDVHLSTYFGGQGIIATSCPPNDRKYYLKAHSIELRPNRSLTLRRAKIFLFGVPIFAVGKLVIPLKPYRRPDHLPEFGRDSVYGWYAKYRYAYDLAERQDGDVMGMVTEKRGLLFGVTHNFGYGSGTWLGSGRAEVLYGTGQGEFTFRGNINQRFGQQLALVANYNLSRNSGYSTASTQSNLTGTLTHQTDVTTTTMSYNQSGTRSGTLSSSYGRISLNQTVRLDQLFNAELLADYNRRTYTGQATDEQLDTRMRFSGQWRLFDWELLDQRRFDLSGQQGTASGQTTEIVPQVTLNTDSRRLRPLGWWGLPDLLDMRFTTTVGEYREPVTGSTSTTKTPQVLRVNFDLNGQLSAWQLGSRAMFTADARYSQSFFDQPNPAAKYIIAFNPAFSYKPLPNQRVDIRYRFQEVAGYSPLLRYDFAQKINDIDLTWNWFVADPVRPRLGKMALTLNGGYDVQTGLYRDLRLGIRANPVDELMIDLNTSYSLEGRGYGDAGLRTVRGQLIWDGGRRWRQELGFTYDPRNGLFGPINSLLRIEPLPRVTLQNALTWDGYTKRVTYNDILVNYDMGCVGLTGSYRQQSSEFRLDLNIAAFRALGSLFGTGRYGQTFSTSPGLQY